MYKKYVEDFEEVLSCAYSRSQINRDCTIHNLKLWEENKAPIRELFRKHPNWDEDLQAIVIEVDRNEMVNKEKVADMLCDVQSRAGYTSSALENIGTSLRYLLDLVDEKGNMPDGTKFSKIINTFLKYYDFGGLPYSVYAFDGEPKTYAQWYAKISDLARERKYKQKIYISINPLDYLTQSHGNFNSCHSLRNKGCYHGATLSTLTDNTSVIVYACSDKGDDNPCLRDKIWRQLLFVNPEGHLAQIWEYPNKSFTDASDCIKEIIKLFEGKTLKLFDESNTRNMSCLMSGLINGDGDCYKGYSDWRHYNRASRLYSWAESINDLNLIDLFVLGNENSYPIDTPQGFYMDCSLTSDNNLVWSDWHDRYINIDEAICVNDSWYIQSEVDAGYVDDVYYCEYHNCYEYSEYFVYINNYGWVCDPENCGFRMCFHCNEWYHEDEMTQDIDGDWYCSDCREELEEDEDCNLFDLDFVEE